MKREDSIPGNVFGGPLQTCSDAPLAAIPAH